MSKTLTQWLEEGQMGGAEATASMGTSHGGAIERLVALGRALAPQVLFAGQERALERLGKGGLLLISPPGTGKSLVGEAAMARALAEDRGVVYLASTRSLAREKCASLVQRLSPLGYRVALSTRDDREEDEAVRGGRVDVVVTVYEKGASFFLQAAGFRQQVGVVVADEAHLLLDPQRGAAARALLHGWMSCGATVVALSSALRDAEELARILPIPLCLQSEGGTGEAGEVDLSRGTARWMEGDKERTRDMGLRLAAGEPLEAVIPDLVEQFEKPMLLFLPTRRSALMAATRLAEGRGCRDVAAVSAGHGVSALLAVRVGLHTAELSREDRLSVEDALRGGEIDVCCCTSTLAEGINVPVRTVLYFPGHGEDDGVRRENCLGRVGRPGQPAGSAWVVHQEPPRRIPLRRTEPILSIDAALHALSFLLAVPSEQPIADRFARLQLPMRFAEVWSRGLRHGLWDERGILTPSGELVAGGGVEAEMVSGWRTVLRRFPNGGAPLANVFLALGGSQRIGTMVPLTADERLSRRWPDALAQALRAEDDVLGRYFLDYLQEPDRLPRRVHQAAKATLLFVFGWTAGENLATLQRDFLCAGGLVEEIASHAAFLLGQCNQLSRQMGGGLGADAPRRLMRPAVVVPIAPREIPAPAGGAPSPSPVPTSVPLRLQIRRGSTGQIFLNGKKMILTQLQFRFLELLARHVGEGIHYERIEQYVWEGSPVERQQVSYHRSKLEKKLQDAAPLADSYLQTIASWGVRLALGRDEVIFEDALIPAILKDDDEAAPPIEWSVLL
jgi:hypothetical protein